MRLLPVAALVFASLIFSVGGVAVVGRADSSAQSSAQAPAQPAEQHECKVPKPFEGHAAQMHSQAARVAAASGVIPLNTRGYNYAYPGDVQMDPTGRTKPGDATPPAAPAKP